MDLYDAEDDNSANEPSQGNVDGAPDVVLKVLARPPPEPAEDLAVERELGLFQSLPLPASHMLKPAAGLGSGCSILESERIIRCAETEDLDFRYTRSETILIGVMLTVKMAEKAVSVYRTHMALSANGTGKREKKETYASTPYDRLLTFADVKDPGKCFAVICQNKQDTCRFFMKGQKQLMGIGNMFVIGEPAHSTSKLGNTSAIKIVEDYSSSVFPLDPVCMRYLPLTPLKNPQLGETLYFSYHGVTTLKIITPSLTDAVCSGLLCDRQANAKTIEKTKFKCGCLHVNSKNVGRVLSMTLEIPCHETFDLSECAVVENFRSIRTSCLFMSEKTMSSLTLLSKKQRSLYRSSISNVVDYINTHGGWTIVGWVRTGAKNDDSDPNAENLASINQAPHVSYLMPSRLQVTNRPYFQNLMYTFNEEEDQVSD
jgi:hypothetical protein